MWNGPRPGSKYPSEELTCPECQHGLKQGKSIRRKLLQEGANLEEELAYAERQLEDGMTRCRMLQYQRNQHLEKLGAGEQVKERAEALAGYAEKGNLMSLILTDAAKQEEWASNRPK